MKITEYAAVTSLNDRNVLLVDGDDGTKKITAPNAAKSLNSQLSPSDFVTPLNDMASDDNGLNMVVTPANTNTMLIHDGNEIKAINLQKLAEGLNSFLTGQQIVDPLNMSVVEKVSSFKAGDQVLIGITDEGKTKAMDVDDILFNLLDEFIPVESRRNIWRGKNLGTSFTAEQKANIANGTFKGFFIGDYWVINNVVYRIVDINYWLGQGDTECNTYHLVIMPDHALYNAQMNTSNDTAGGYIAAKNRGILTNAINTVNAAFGAGNVLTHRELLTNATSNGYASAGSWYDSTLELPNEIMMYGTQVFTNVCNGTAVPYSYTIDKTQLAGMRLCPKLINPHRENQWLRDVVSATHFAYVSSDGLANATYASASLGVRPVFGIKG